VAQIFGGNTLKNIMTYKGYMGRIEFDARDNIFIGKVLGIEDSITFHGTTVKELRADFEAAVKHYVSDCAATGRKPFKPVSKASGKSLNQWAAEVLDEAAHIH
jgi:predicted HicB family RNase H-like nuclease